MATQAIQAVQATAGQIAQASSDNHSLTGIAIAVSVCSLIVSLTSVYVALKNNWIANRDAGKKALVQFYDYSKQACELAMANFYGQEFNKDRYVHLIGVEFFAKLEKAGRTKQVKEAIDDLIKHFNILLTCCSTEKKSTEELLKILSYIDLKCMWLIEEYTFRVYLGNLLLLFK